MDKFVKILPMIALPFFVYWWWKRYQKVTTEGFQFNSWVVRFLISLVLLLILIALTHTHFWSEISN